MVPGEISKGIPVFMNESRKNFTKERLKVINECIPGGISDGISRGISEKKTILEASSEEILDEFREEFLK